MSSSCKTKQSDFSEHCFQGQMLWWLEKEKMQLYIISLGEGQILEVWDIKQSKRKGKWAGSGDRKVHQHQ